MSLYGSLVTSKDRRLTYSSLYNLSSLYTSGPERGRVIIKIIPYYTSFNKAIQFWL